MFFYIVKTLILHMPKCFMLENVKNLLTHDKGKTFNIIKEVLISIGYILHYTTLNAKDFGLPQNRERAFIVGFKYGTDFKFPEGQSAAKFLYNILDSNVPEKYFISQRYLNGLKRHRARNKAKGNGFGYIVLDNNDIANTIVCGGSGHERNLIQDLSNMEKNDEGIRKMTPREWARLQGFPEDFKLPCSNTQTYKQLANSVPIPVIEAIAKQMKEVLI